MQTVDINGKRLALTRSHEDDDDYERVIIEGKSYKFKMKKTDENGNPLQGALLKISKASYPERTDGEGYIEYTGRINEINTEYTMILEEYLPPDGYENVLENVAIKVKYQMNSSGELEIIPQVYNGTNERNFLLVMANNTNQQIPNSGDYTRAYNLYVTGLTVEADNTKTPKEIVVSLKNPKTTTEGKYSLKIKKVNKSANNTAMNGVTFNVKEGDNGNYEPYTTVSGFATVKNNETIEESDLGTTTFTIQEGISFNNSNKYIKLNRAIPIHVKKWKNETTDRYEVKEISLNGTDYGSTVKLENVTLEDGRTKVDITATLSNGTITVTIPNVEVSGEYSLRVKKVDADNNNNIINGIKFGITEGSSNQINTYGPTDGGIADVYGGSKATKKITAEGTDTYTISEIDTGDTEYVKISGTLQLKVTKTIVNSVYKVTSVNLIYNNQEATFNNSTKKTVVNNVSLENDNRKVTVTATLDENSQLVELIIPNRPKPGKYSLNIKKINSENEQEVIEGAKFKVKEGSTEITPEGGAVTNENGIVQIIRNREIIAEGTDTFVITEIEVDENKYIPLNEELKVVVIRGKDSDGDKYELKKATFDTANGSTQKEHIKLKDNSEVTANITKSGNTIVVTIRNAPITGLYGLKVKKVDADNNNAPIQGVKFTVNNKKTTPERTGSNGEASYVDNTKMQITKDNWTNTDTYTIKEIDLNGKNYLKIANNQTIVVKVKKKIQNYKYVVESAKFDDNTTIKTITLEGGKTVQVTVSVEIDATDPNTKKVVVTIPNKPKPAYYTLNIKKVDNSVNPVKAMGGVTFKVNDGQTDRTTAATNSSTGITNVISNKEINVDTVGTDTYTVKEISLPTSPTDQTKQYLKLRDNVKICIKTEKDGDKYKFTSATFDSVSGSTSKQVYLQDGTTKVNINLTSTTNADTNTTEVVLTIPNSQIKGKYGLNIEKIDSANPSKKIKGAKFKVKAIDTNTTPQEDDDVETNSSGIATYTNTRMNITKDDYNKVDKYEITEVGYKEGDVEKKYFKSGDNIYYVKLQDPIKIQVTKNLVGFKYEATKIEFLNGTVIQGNANTRKFKLEGNKGNVDVTVGFETIDNVKTVKLTIQNTQMAGEYDLQVKKVSEATQEEPNEKSLNGIKFKYNSDQTEYTTTGEGTVKLGGKKKINSSNLNQKDSYTITEVLATGSQIVTAEDEIDYIGLEEPITIYVKKHIAESGTEFEVEDVSFDENNYSQANKTKKVKLQNYDQTHEEITASISLNKQTGTVELKVQNRKVTGEYGLKLIKKDETENGKLKDVQFTCKYEEYVTAEKYKSADIEYTQDGQGNFIGLVENKTLDKTDINGKTEIFSEAKGMNKIDSRNVHVIDKYTFGEEKEQEGYIYTNGKDYVALAEEFTVYVKKKLEGTKYIASAVGFDPECTDTTKQVRLSNGNYVTLVASLEDGNITVTIPNTRVKGQYEINLLKTDKKDGKTPVKDAVFDVTIKKGNEEVTLYDSEGNEINTKGLVTDEEGKLSIKDIAITERATYKCIIEEVSVPEPYVLPIENPIEIEFETIIRSGVYYVKEDLENEINKEAKAKCEAEGIDFSVKNGQFDLALRKFITAVREGVGTEEENTKNYTYRNPQFIFNQVENDDGTTTETYSYKHTKEPVLVETDDIVEYTIRVYNEGTLDGYANLIRDDIPQYLEFLPEDSVNQEYGWKYADADGNILPEGADLSEAKCIVTDYLSKANERDGRETILEEFSIDKYKLGEMKEPNYRDIKVAFKVNIPREEKNRVIINHAQISDDQNKKGEEVKDRDSTTNEWNEGEDDQDIEKIRVLEFDLALQKFITGVYEGVGTEEENFRTIDDRKPEFSIETDGRYVYKNENKVNPVTVETDDIVQYTIRVYNEDEIAGYAEEIKDTIPEGLEFVTPGTGEGQSKVNEDNGWKLLDEYGKELTEDADKSTAKYISTDVLSKQKESEKGENLLKPFNEDTYKRGGIIGPDYRDVQVEFRVTVPYNETERIVINEAQISEDSNKYGKDIEDKDSDPHEWTDCKEDDEDKEKIRVLEFDLALRKFITAVREGVGSEEETRREVTDRVPEFSIKQEENEEGIEVEKYVYEHTKEPVTVETTDIVEYTLRVYNENEIAGYAKEIKDNIPEGLEFLPEDELNQIYRWKMKDEDGNITDDVNKAKYVVTDYLSKEQEKEQGKPRGEYLINAFNKQQYENGDIEEPYYKEVKIAFKVTVPHTEKNRIVINEAQISEDSNKYGKDIDDKDSNPHEWTDCKEDDEDIEKIRVLEFDLALRKFITAVRTGVGTEEGYTTELKDRYPVFRLEETTNESGEVEEKYIYEHTKEPVLVKSKDIVEYNIRVYNENEIAGYAKVIKDEIPEGLEFLPEDEVNKIYKWEMLDENENPTTDAKKAKYIVTKYLSKENELVKGEHQLRAFDKDAYKRGEISEPDWRTVKVAFKVTTPNSDDRVIINKAQVSDDSNKYGNDIDDKDSIPDEWNEGEDDQDIEPVRVLEFDLALRKFITGVRTSVGTPEAKTTGIFDREPVFKVDKDGNYIYEHTKEPVRVGIGNVVEYTLRVYNEGEYAGYATEIKDDIPEGLEFLPEDYMNTKYGWKMQDENGNVTDDIKKAKYIVTDYLSKEKEEEKGANLIGEFDKEGYKEGLITEPDWKEVKVAFKVIVQKKDDEIIKNEAQISDDSDEFGTDVDDIDSEPDKWNEGEDDQDIENLIGLEFDLALRKWVTKTILIEDGKEIIQETGHTAEDNPEKIVKTDLKKSKIKDIVLKYEYKIRVTNEGEIAGYAKEISDYIPEGLRFEASDNPLWKEQDGKVVTDQLKDKLLEPGQTAEVSIILTWINREDNMGLKINVAEISKDSNEYGTKDRDSVPNNQVKEEDDIDEAPVMITIKTGQTIVYVGIMTMVITILGIGIVLIKKYALN